MSMNKYEVVTYRKKRSAEVDKPKEADTPKEANVCEEPEVELLPSAPIQRRYFSTSYLDYENNVFESLMNDKRVSDAYATYLVNLHADVILYGFTQQLSPDTITDNVYCHRC